MKPLFFLLAILPAYALNIETNARSAILMDADTGQVIFEKNARESLYPASISKVATALLVLEERGDSLDEMVIASREAVASVSPAKKRSSGYSTPSHWIEQGSSHIGIKRGEELPVRALLHGLMLQSGNDAANVLAEYVSGTIPEFLDLLNARLRELGCTKTHLTNPHGLHHPEQTTCAYDMALVTREALQHDTFREIVSTLCYERPKTNLQPAVQLPQKNRLIKRGPYYYDKAIGIKVGYTSDAKGTFITAATDGDRTLIVVVMGCDPFVEAYRDAARLLDAGFAEYNARN